MCTLQGVSGRPLNSGVRAQMNAGAQRTKSGRASAAIAFVIAMVVGVALGWVTARIAPADKFSLIGLIFVPFWIVLEFLLEATVSVLGERGRGARLLSLLGLAGGFYVTLFAIRAVAL
jgi:ABC-type spermidine/putrescine transport system permease subunit I